MTMETTRKSNFVFFFISMILVVLFVDRPQVSGQERDAGNEKTEYLAIFYPLKSTTLSAEVSGVIKQINFEMGQTFKRGEVLINLDQDYFFAERRKAQATEAFAAALYKSKKELFDQKSVSAVEFAKAEADYAISKANFRIADKKLADCSIRAPYKGRVVKLLAREDEYVLEGQALVEIIDDRVIRVKFHLPASLYAQVAIGQVYPVKLKTAAGPFECKITHISPIIESNTNSFQVFAEINNAERQIRSGMTGYVIMEPAME